MMRQENALITSSFYLFFAVFTTLRECNLLEQGIDSSSNYMLARFLVNEYRAETQVVVVWQKNEPEGRVELIHHNTESGGDTRLYCLKIAVRAVQELNLQAAFTLASTSKSERYSILKY